MYIICANNMKCENIHTVTYYTLKNKVLVILTPSVFLVFIGQTCLQQNSAEIKSCNVRE